MTTPNLPSTESGHEDDLFDDLDLACSTCNHDLSGDEAYARFRVCDSCGRHYWLPARERIALLADSGSFAETNQDIVSVDPLLFHDRLSVPDRLAESREQPAASEAIVSGIAKVDGRELVIVALDLGVIGSSIGIIAGEKIALAVEDAVSRRLPLLAICSGGSNLTREGVLTLAQTAKVAASVARLRRAGMPLIALVTHPTSGNTLIGLVNQADLILAEPGAQVALAHGHDPRSLAVQLTTDALAATGMIDQIIPRGAQRQHLSDLLSLIMDRGHITAPQPVDLPAVMSSPSPLEPDHKPDTSRPAASDYLAVAAQRMFHVGGDPLLGDAPGVIGGIARVAGASCVVYGIERGAARMDAASFGKVTRLLRLAAQFELPVVAVVETDRAVEVMDHRSAVALADLLSTALACPVPIVTLGVGEVTGVAGSALLTGDRMLLVEHATIAQTPGDTVASSRDCLRLGLIDRIVPEPVASAGDDHTAGVESASHAIAAALAELSSVGPRRLLDERTRKFRQLGLATEAGREIALHEVRELQDLQRLLERSMDDLRHRLEHRLPSLPSLSAMPQLSLPAINLPRIRVHKPDMSEFASRVQATRRALLREDAPASAGASVEQSGSASPETSPED